MRLNRVNIFVSGVAAALLLVAAVAVRAEPVGEKVVFDSRNYEGIPELLIGRAYLDVKVQAYLSVPSTGATKYPAVIIEHDSFGVSDDEFDYAKDLNAAGFATLVLDEYTDRRVRNRDDTFNPTRAADALFALKYLATNTMIDANRVAIVGFSRGGTAAYLTSIEAVRKAVLGSSNLRFGAHAAFYPTSPSFIVSPFTKAPVRFFFGREDNVAPVAPWMEYFAYLRSVNAAWAVENEVYEGGHGFERGYVRRQDRAIPTVARCVPVYYRLQGPRTELFKLTQGKLVNMTREEMSTTNCALLGGAVGTTNNTTRMKAREDLKAFLARAMPAP